MLLYALLILEAAQSSGQTVWVEGAAMSHTPVLGKVGETRYSKVQEGSPGKVFCNKNLQMIFDIFPGEYHMFHHAFQEKPSPALPRMNAL